MASNPNSGYSGRDESIQRSNSFFSNNNAFPGLDPTMSNGQPLSNNENWDYDTGRLNLAHNHNPSATLYPGWHSTTQQHNLSSNDVPQGRDAYYDKSFTNGVSSFSSSTYVPTPAFGNPAQTEYNPRYGNSSVVDGTTYESETSTFANSGPHLNTIAPGALQSRPSSYPTTSSAALPQRNPSSQQALRTLPKSIASGRFSLINADSLSRATSSRKLHNFLHVGDEPQDVWSTKTTIPAYIPRKSRNEIKKLLADDIGVTAKVAKKHSRRLGSIQGNEGISDRRNSVNVSKRADEKREDSASSLEPDSSDDDSASDSSEEESMQAPLPAVRPSKPIEAVKYDTIKTLWRVPYRSATSDDIRKGLAEFWDIVRTIRDRWKTDTQAVKEAEEANQVNELPLLKDRVSTQREMLEAALQAAITEGHKDIVEHLAENLPLMAALAQFLRDRVNNADLNGDLSKVILQILSRCKTLTDGSLEKIGFAKLLPRFVKRADEGTRIMAKRISDNATAATKRRKDVAKTGTGTFSQPKETKPLPQPNQKVESPIAGLKRPRVTDSSGDPPPKRLAADTAISGKIAAGQVKPLLTKRSSSGSDANPLTAATVASKKPTQVVAKPSSFFTNNFSGLQSAKRSAAVNSAVAKPSAVNKAVMPSVKSSTNPTIASSAAVQKTVLSATKPLFSIADTLASVSRPREVESVVKREESVPPESIEERARRLRKEERRRLRVSFKPDDFLVEIRVMSPKFEEDLSPNAFEVRDAGDIDSEGRMFKLKHNEDMMDIDDEEEADAGTIDDLSRPYNTPSSIDFSALSQEERERMYAPFGGGVLEADCPERLVQEQREANTLIAIYTRPSDIPPTPREPADAVEAPGNVLQFGAPPEFVMSRLESMQNAQKASSLTGPAISGIDLAALLSAMPRQTPQQVPQPIQQQPLSLPQQQQQPQQQASQAATTELEKIFAQFSKPAQQPAAPPAPQQQQIPAAAAQFPFVPGFFGLPNLQPNLQPQAYQQPAQAPVVPGVPDNISAMLATLQQSGQMPNLMGGTMPDFSQFSQMQGYGNAPNYQQQQQQPYGFENPERRRMIEGGGAEGGQNDGNEWRDSKPWLNKKKEGRPTPKFVVQCKYWKEGKCRKGADCTFLHTE